MAMNRRQQLAKAREVMLATARRAFERAFGTRERLFKRRMVISRTQVIHLMWLWFAQGYKLGHRAGVREGKSDGAYSWFVLHKDTKRWKDAYTNLKEYCDSRGWDTTCYGPNTGPDPVTRFSVPAVAVQKWSGWMGGGPIAPPPDPSDDCREKV